MGFKITSTEDANFNSPQEMYEDYKRRKIQGLINHQSDMIDKYMRTGLERQNIALELPTGSGKTLIGLVIGEYRRRKRKEKVLYLCPTNQLVQQTANQAIEKYGIKVNTFTGKIKEYSQESKSEYLMCDAIAVTNYSSFFNSSTFFKDPDVIIFDDAHSAEQYISSNWSVTIPRKYEIYYKMILDLVKNEIPESTYNNFYYGDLESSYHGLVDKVPSMKLVKYHSDLYSLINSIIDVDSIKYPWENIKNNLVSCNLFLSYDHLVLRPLIPPTETHVPFRNAKQKLFMSATLGLSGELERTTGLENITRLEIANEWKKKSVGRRYFMFPNLYYDNDKNLLITEALTKIAGRSVILVESNNEENQLSDYFIKKHYPVFSGKVIDTKKQEYCNTDNAIAVLANRYDGVDFSEDECRVLVINSIPTNTHIQEKFLTSRMAASILFEERVRTRFLQAIGRCTRSLVDYAVVCIFGEDVIASFLTPQKITKLHPEIQSEINFGIEQSKTPESFKEYINLVNLFLSNGAEWGAVEKHLISERDKIVKSKESNKEDNYYEILRDVSKYEVRYQYSIWKENYTDALNNIDIIIAKLNAPKLKGYRGFWCYLGACASFLNNRSDKAAINKYLSFATESTLNVSWFSKLIEKTEDKKDEVNYLLEEYIMNIENQILLQGSYHGNKFEKTAAEILNLLNSTDGDDFERGHNLIGTFIGYNSHNSEHDGDPDPWWIVNENIYIVSEDKIYKSVDRKIPIDHVRQANGHKKWIFNKYSVNQNTSTVITIFITNSTTLDQYSVPFADEIYYVNREEFVQWCSKAINSIRTIRRSFVEVGDLIWRDSAINTLIEDQTTPMHYINFIKKSKLNSITTK